MFYPKIFIVSNHQLRRRRMETTEQQLQRAESLEPDHYDELVICKKCKREYICHPDDDYYDAPPNNNQAGLCRKCYFTR